MTQPPRTGLKIREYPNVGMVVVGLEENYLTNPEEIFKCLALGTENRMVSSTNQNARSSRSHTVFIIAIEQKFLDGSQKVSKLNLVDLVYYIFLINNIHLNCYFINNMSIKYRLEVRKFQKLELQGKHWKKRRFKIIFKFTYIIDKIFRKLIKVFLA